VGVWYLKDGEVKKNYEEALTYLSISANLKSEKLLETVQEVSDFYFYTSVLEDNIEYMKTSAALGNENALYALGVLYLNGDKVERNVPKALLYLEKLALEDIEDPDLLSNLGYVYLEGKEVKQNIPKAVLYFEKAGIESIEDPNLLSILGYLYLKGKGGEKNIEKALPYLEKAAEMGNTDALQDLSILYINGDGVEKDIKKALFYIKNLSLPNIEDIHLLYFIGHSYFKGKEVKKNLTEALPYLEKAAEMGNKKALQDLSILHITTDGVEKDVKKALFNIEKIGLENIKNSTLLYNLGRIYFEGKEVEKNVKKALWYLEKAAGMGNRNALKDLSIFYINTDGIEKSIHKAVWYLKQLENIEDQNL
jgi:TPR repeat protein